jgi:hypothetical protein
MSSLNSRLKGFGFKRKSSAPSQPQGSASPNPSLLQSPTPPPGPPQIPPLFPSRPGHAPSSASNPSLTSLQMNHPGAGPRPPSYSANYPPGPPGPIGRTSPLANQGPTRTPPSQMIGGPPPINTGAPPVAGYPPPVMGGGPPPVPGGPPGYGAGPTGYPPPAPPQQTGPIAPYGRNTAAEVEGNSRSKAQLIVGIDFVSKPSFFCWLLALRDKQYCVLTAAVVLGYHLLRRCLCLCDQQRSQGRYYY